MMGSVSYLHRRDLVLDVKDPVEIQEVATKAYLPPNDGQAEVHMISGIVAVALPLNAGLFFGSHALGGIPRG
jgi:hypothetical protein